MGRKQKKEEELKLSKKDQKKVDKLTAQLPILMTGFKIAVLILASKLSTDLFVEANVHNKAEIHNVEGRGAYNIGEDQSYFTRAHSDVKEGELKGENEDRKFKEEGNSEGIIERVFKSVREKRNGRDPESEAIDDYELRGVRKLKSDYTTETMAAESSMAVDSKQNTSQGDSLEKSRPSFSLRMGAKGRIAKASFALRTGVKGRIATKDDDILEAEGSEHGLVAGLNSEHGMGFDHDTHKSEEVYVGVTVSHELPQSSNVMLISKFDRTMAVTVVDCPSSGHNFVEVRKRSASDNGQRFSLTADGLISSEMCRGQNLGVLYQYCSDGTRIVAYPVKGLHYRWKLNDDASIESLRCPGHFLGFDEDNHLLLRTTKKPWTIIRVC